VQLHILMTHKQLKNVLLLVLHTCMPEPSMVENVGVQTHLVLDQVLPPIAIVL